MSDGEHSMQRGMLPALFITLGLIVAGYFIGAGFSNFRMADRYVTVKGLVEKDVRANLAVWNIRFTATGDDLTQVQEKIESDKTLVMNFLKEKGLSESDYAGGRIQVTDLLAQSYRPEGAMRSRFIINSSVGVRTEKVGLVVALSQKTGDLVRKGVVLTEYQGPSYIFTKLNEIKPEMIAEATSNAREAALQFARDSKSKLGKIRRANQGVFIIMSRDGNSGGPEDQQVDKKVRVVSTVDYFLKS